LVQVENKSRNDAEQGKAPGGGKRMSFDHCVDRRRDCTRGP